MMESLSGHGLKFIPGEEACEWFNGPSADDTLGLALHARRSVLFRIGSFWYVTCGKEDMSFRIAAFLTGLKV